MHYPTGHVLDAHKPIVRRAPTGLPQRTMSDSGSAARWVAAVRRTRGITAPTALSWIDARRRTTVGVTSVVDGAKLGGLKDGLTRPQHLNQEEFEMNDAPDDLRERGEHHAKEAERLLKSRWLSTHVKAQVHATPAVYYLGREERS